MSVTVLDVTVRDGSHTVDHSFTPTQVAAIVDALGAAGVKIVEVGHGEGLGASSLSYGFGLHSEDDLVSAAVSAAGPHGMKVSVVVIPGIGTGEDVARAVDLGATVARVATLSTEADVGIQHIGQARDAGCLTAGFLTMSHLAEPGGLAEQAKIHAAAGAQIVYCADSAGTLTTDQVAARIAGMRHVLDDQVAVGFHGHNNIGLAVANSIMAIREGAEYVDTALRGLGAGAGNTATEVLAAACDRSGIATGIDVSAAADAAEEIVLGIVATPTTLDRASLMLGWAGVPSTFLLHSQRAAERYGVAQHDLLVELGRRKFVSGQEDMILDVAIELTATDRT